MHSKQVSVLRHNKGAREEMYKVHRFERRQVQETDNCFEAIFHLPEKKLI